MQYLEWKYRLDLVIMLVMTKKWRMDWALKGTYIFCQIKECISDKTQQSDTRFEVFKVVFGGWIIEMVSVTIAKNVDKHNLGTKKKDKWKILNTS